MTTSAETKRDLRAKSKAKLLKLSLDKENFYSRQHKLIEKIEMLSEFKKAKTILSYYPLESELDLSSMLISNPDKRWVFPRPIGKSIMLLFEVGELHHLKDAKYGVKVPPSTNTYIKPEELDLIIIPALAFDSKGYRLGRGGAYYDKLLSKIPKTCKTIGVSFTELLVDKLPVEDHDIPVQKIISV